MTLTAQCSTDSDDRLRRAKGMVSGRIAALAFYKSLVAKTINSLGVNLTLGRELKDRDGYVRLIDHWNAVLPGQVLRVGYQDVVPTLSRR